jgi:hypothetical protein
MYYTRQHSTNRYVCEFQQELISSRLQYEAFWTARHETSIVWVALLFTILRIAVSDWVREGDEPQEFAGKGQDMAGSFRNCSIDCLILADYMLPHEHLIEALIHHLYAEYASTRDFKPNAWVLLGLINRMAMRMGYHQDTQPLLQTSPFHVSRLLAAYLNILS